MLLYEYLAKEHKEEPSVCHCGVDENLKCGDWGYLASDFYSLDDMARRAETISYEIMSRVGKNKRVDVKYI